jgi:prepilin-type N-terminal cleavage/methylation domain-containing protein
MRRQQGFTLIEIVIAFTILTMSTVLVVNLVTQSSSRVSRVEDHLAAMDTLETAIAVLRGELARRVVKDSYSGSPDGEYRWVAHVVGQANPAANGARQYLNLYRVRFEIYHDSERPILELITLLPDR